MIEKFSKIIDVVKSVAEELHADIYIVGGAVRDIVLGEAPSDIDFVVIEGNYQAVARKVAKRVRSNAIPFKDNMRIPYNGDFIDISAPRANTLEADLKLRDFTINNLAIDMRGNLIGDVTDIKAKIIRPTNDNAFIDDPLRILRGYRLAATLSFALSDSFSAMARRDIHLIKETAAERIHDEIYKLINTDNPTNSLRKMSEDGVWAHILGCEPDLQKIEAVLSCHAAPNTRFALFLAAVGDGADKIAQDNSTKKLIQNLLNATKLLNADDESIKLVVWRYHDIMQLVLIYAKACTDTDEEIYNTLTSFMEKVDFEKATVINGNDILQIGAQHMKKPGGWIAPLLEKTHIKLAFSELAGREAAIKYMDECVGNNG